MALPIANIEKILTGSGALKFDGTGAFNPYSSGLPSCVQEGGQSNHIMCTTKIGKNDITFQGLKQGVSGADAINIAYVGSYFTYGKLKSPGYVYSGGFSGCCFYLYRDGEGFIWGVHAARQSGTLADPTEYFNRQGHKLLWQWDSLGKLSDQQLLAGNESAVLCCADLDTIYAYALTMKGQTVVSIADSSYISNWRRFSRPPIPPKPAKSVASGKSVLSKLLKRLRS